MSRIKSQLTFGDLTGGINNVNTKETLNSTPRRTETPDMVNVEYFGLGGIKSMEGNTQIGDSQNDRIVGGWEYTKGSERHMMIATRSGYVKRYNKTTNVFDEVFRFEDTSDKVSFCNMNNGVVVSNGVNDLMFYEHGRNIGLTGKLTLTKRPNTNPQEYTNEVVGEDTNFGTECRVGDYITIDGSELKYKIESITDKTHMTLDKDVVLMNGAKYYGWNGTLRTVKLYKTGQVDCSLLVRNYTEAASAHNTFSYKGNGVYNNLGSHMIINGYDYYYDEAQGTYRSTGAEGSGSFIYPGITDDNDYDSYSAGYYISQNKIYKASDDSLVNDSQTWLKLIYAEEDVRYIYALTTSNILWCLDRNSDTLTRVSTTPFTVVTGCSGTVSEDSFTYNVYGYGITNAGKLYRLNGSIINQVGSATGWSRVTGYTKCFNGHTSYTKSAIAYNSTSGVAIIVGSSNNIASGLVALFASNSLNYNKFSGSYIHTSPSIGTIYPFVYYNNNISYISYNGYQNTLSINNFKNTNIQDVEDIFGYAKVNGIYISGEANVVTDEIVYRCSLSYEGEFTRMLPHWVSGDGGTGGFAGYDLVPFYIATSNPKNGDVIRSVLSTPINTVYTRTLNLNLDTIYSEPNLSSKMTNVKDVGTSSSPRLTLYYSDYTEASGNPKIYKYFSGSREKGEQYDTINYDESIDPQDGLDFSLSEISALNAYLVNTNPEAKEQDLHQSVRGLAIQYYAGRLWVGGDEGLFYSAVGQPGNWDKRSDAGRFDTLYNDSSGVKALGIWSEFLMIHKEFSTYLLSCTGNSESIEVKPYSNITCESQQSWIVSNTKYFVFSKDFLDIYPLVQRTVFSDKFLGEPISQNVRNTFKDVRIEDTDQIFCVSRPRERQMLFYMPMQDTVASSTAMIFDFQTKSWLKRVVPQEVTTAFNYDNKIYIGTNDGKVLEEFSGQTFDGKPIVAYYKSPWFDWANGYTQSFAEFLMEIDSSRTNNFYIRTQKDGQSRYEDRIINGNDLFNKSLIWSGDEPYEYSDTYWDQNYWTKISFDNIRVLLPNNVFEDFQIEIGTRELGQAFAIYCYAFRRIETEEDPW